MWSLTDTAVNTLVKSGDLEQAADFVHKLLLEYPLWSHGKDAFRRIAFLHGMAGNWYRAQKMARRYMKTSTADAYTPDMLYLLAVSLEQMGHVRQASLSLQRFVLLFPDHKNLSAAKSKLASLATSSQKKL
jgi:TolA-binding protein